MLFRRLCGRLAMSPTLSGVAIQTLHSGRTIKFGGSDALRLGDTAPDFTAPTTHGLIRFHEWKADKWALLFSRCHNFSLLGVTELDTVAALVPELDERDTKVIGVSADPLDPRRHWESNVEGETDRPLTFPLIADPDRRIAGLYGMIHPNDRVTTARHSAVVIGPDNTLRLTMTYPASIAGNVVELLRAIDCLQLAAT
jgi:thioredoxin-dependent peroxiredoxin